MQFFFLLTVITTVPASTTTKSVIKGARLKEYPVCGAVIAGASFSVLEGSDGSVSEGCSAGSVSEDSVSEGIFWATVKLVPAEPSVHTISNV